ncbi:tetratricopeptide repeat protein [Ihubacter sp. rT4E-8]|uniref:tetratricopeptide repeat protein n=1 Tax=Ihubacter sp. rT4E-8 TaxID=3242369 RepID=UPI003CE8E5B0
MEMKRIQDRIGEYLISHVDDFLFDELSDNYLEKAGIADILSGVPVPIRKTALSNLSTLVIAQNMAFIVGCDLNFKYRDNYVAYILRTFTKDFARPLIGDGVEAAAKNDFDHACICFRAALLIDPDNVDALYCYGRACKDSYENGEGEEYIGRYKAESLEAFEKLTLKKPDFDMGFYFLGYGYLNLGLYMKAKLTWETFMKLSENQEQKDEVSGWLAKLEEPVRIEEGYNHVLAGRFDEGISVLAGYEDDTRFNTWWPLWYYLGVAYQATGERDMAKERFLQVLKLSPSNVEAMDELAALYEAEGNMEMADKYRKKIQVVKQNAELDRAEKAEGMS